jgi:hypothetical protein
LDGQQARELRNTLYELSHEIAQCHEAQGIIHAVLTRFPLVDGISNRVGLLRGAGNSICPQVAAEFIKAVMDIL